MCNPNVAGFEQGYKRKRLSHTETFPRTGERWGSFKMDLRTYSGNSARQSTAPEHGPACSRLGHREGGKRLLREASAG